MAAIAKIFDLLPVDSTEKRCTRGATECGEQQVWSRSARTESRDFNIMFAGEMAMVSTSTSTAAMASDSKLSSLGGIEALNLKVGPVRRNLFGPVDHQQLQQDFRRLLCMSVEVANKRWNFDFQSEMPGNGTNVEWEELRCQDVPAFYRSCTVRPAAPPQDKRRTSSSSGDSSPASSSSSGSGDEYLELTTRGCYRLKRQGKRRQSAITDFFKVKKTKLLHYKASSRQ
ncbi:Cyclin-dependent kinase inhibitor 1 [Nibea albiflora]|uniref:Cyclin-dependent kinase inhibitor 1 n=1 Tax=Nibea albiflora TaxID=240163 RepID=A0ACB7EV03_NIBAL|nr:Cyclin-dependent kinase inhibitor 1 [Nibea albiflora]